MRILLSSILVLFCSSLLAQSELYDEPTIIYERQHYGGLNLNSQGGGLFFNYGKYQTAHKINFLTIELAYLKHEKETKSFNPVYEDSKSYVLGKQNNFYILRPGFGRKTIVADKLRKAGVQVSYTWYAGASLGITKPVYLEIGYPELPYQYLNVERYDPDKHFSDDIYGRASGIHGLDELKLHPGVFGKFAFNFEYSNEKDRLKGLEAGVTMDAYPRLIPIMAEKYDDVEDEEINHRLFLTFYLKLFIGKKYNIR